VKRQQKQVVVIGGGTGTSVVLAGLKHFPLDLTAVVPVTDDGGSTGRLRDEFGFLPVGDARQCLAALSTDGDDFRQLLLYRFDRCQGLKGHNLGNLILTALEDLLGSEPAALTAAAKIFRLKGRVLPVSLKLVKLVAEYGSGKTIKSEHQIEVNHLNGDRIIKLATEPVARVNPEVKQAILAADLITIGPGDLYDSLMANLVIKGMPLALRKTKAKLVHIVNLMTLNSQTSDMSAKDHLKVIEDYLGRSIDWIIINKQPIPKSIKQAYGRYGEFPVKDDLGQDQRVIRRRLLAGGIFQKPKGDTLKRSLLRHDSVKLAKTLVNLLK